MQSIGIRTKMSKNTELWGMTGTGNVWEKMSWPGYTGDQTNRYKRLF